MKYSAIGEEVELGLTILSLDLGACQFKVSITLTIISVTKTGLTGITQFQKYIVTAKVSLYDVNQYFNVIFPSFWPLFVPPRLLISKPASLFVL